MRQVSDSDLIPQHVHGVRLDVKHACPECPSPLAGGLTTGPTPFCRYCRGTGLLTAGELARGQRETDAAAAAAGGR